MAFKKRVVSYFDAKWKVSTVPCAISQLISLSPKNRYHQGFNNQQMTENPHSSRIHKIILISTSLPIYYYPPPLTLPLLTSLLNPFLLTPLLSNSLLLQTSTLHSSFPSPSLLHQAPISVSQEPTSYSTSSPLASSFLLPESSESIIFDQKIC